MRVEGVRERTVGGVGQVRVRWRGGGGAEPVEVVGDDRGWRERVLPWVVAVQEGEG